MTIMICERYIKGKCDGISIRTSRYCSAARPHEYNSHCCDAGNCSQNKNVNCVKVCILLDIAAQAGRYKWEDK